MSTTNFISEYGHYFIAIIFAITFLLLAIKILILDRENGEPLNASKVTLLFLLSIISAVSVSLIKNLLQKPEQFLSKFDAFWNSIDWNFWGYYVLFPILLTIAIISIMITWQSNKKKGN